MTWFYNLLFLWIFIGLCTFLYLIFSKTIAPYGRHSNSNWGITIDNKWGWFWMELPALVLMPAIILFSPVEKNGIIVLIIGLWILHYFYRTILFPIKLKAVHNAKLKVPRLKTITANPIHSTISPK